MTELSLDRAWLLYLSEEWRNWDDTTLVCLQLHQPRTLCPWPVFKSAIDNVMGEVLTTADFCKKKTLIKAFHLRTKTQPFTDADWRKLLPNREIRNKILTDADIPAAAFFFNQRNKQTDETDNEPLTRTIFTRTR